MPPSTQVAVEKAALAVGGAEEPEVATADGEHGPKSEVKFVGDLRGFVDDEEREGGEAADGFLSIAGQTDDSGAVGEKQRDVICAVAARFYAESAGKCFGFSEEFGALAFAWAGNDNEGSCVDMGSVDGGCGAEGGLTPLACAVEDDAMAGRLQEACLRFIGVEVEALAHEFDDVDSVGEAGDDVRGGHVASVWCGGMGAVVRRLNSANAAQNASRAEAIGRRL